MPLPMVHLLLAEKIGEKVDKPVNTAFLLGSIAPDAIHMRPGTNRGDKHKTHFFKGQQWTEKEIRQHWELVENIMEEYADASLDVYHFVSGYCIHTLLDATWIVQFFNVLAMTLRAGGIGFEDIRTKYYAETNACDTWIYQQKPWVSRVKEQLMGAPEIGFPDLLSAGEVTLWRDTVLEKMHRYETTKPKEVFYITPPAIESFIDALADEILSFFAAKGYSLLSFPGKKI